MSERGSRWWWWWWWFAVEGCRVIVRVDDFLDLIVGFNSWVWFIGLAAIRVIIIICHACIDLSFFQHSKVHV